MRRRGEALFLALYETTRFFHRNSKTSNNLGVSFELGHRATDIRTPGTRFSHGPSPINLVPDPLIRSHFPTVRVQPRTELLLLFGHSENAFFHNNLLFLGCCLNWSVPLLEWQSDLWLGVDDPLGKIFIRAHRTGQTGLNRCTGAK